MKRILTAVALLGVLAACVPLESSTSSSSSPNQGPRGPVIMYGDSLLESARPYVQSTDQVRAFGGTALCDWIDNMARAAAVEQPSVMVVEFVGNNVTPCMSGHDTPDEIRAKYEADADTLKQRVEAPILWVGPPLFRNGPAPTAGLWDAEPLFVDAGEAVLRRGKYADTLPCLPDEGAAQGCVDGRIRVRAPDGAHFGEPTSDYVSGARRFADAIDKGVSDLG